MNESSIPNLNPQIAVADTQPAAQESSISETIARRTGNAVAIGALTLEMVPVLNESVRLAIVAGAEAYTGSPLQGTAAWFAGTLAFEGAGTAAIIHLMHTDGGEKLIDKFRYRNSKIGGVKTNAWSEGAIAITAGAPMATLIKHQQLPDQSKRADYRYGMITSLGVSAVATVNVSPVIAGLTEAVTNPDKQTGLSLLALGAAGITGALLWGKNKYKALRNRADEASANNYRACYDATSDGPQVEGMLKEEVEAAVNDADTLNLLLRGSATRVPVITPLQYNEEFNTAYFDEKYPDKPVYYLSRIIEATEYEREFSTRLLNDKLRSLAEKGSVIVTDYRKDKGEYGPESIERLLAASGVDFERDEFIDQRNDSSAAVTHFAGKGHLKPNQSGVYYDTVDAAFNDLREADPSTYNAENGTMLITSNEMTDELFSAIWTMYSERFDELMLQNPCMQKQTEEDFRKMLTNEAAITAIKFEAGSPICAAYFVRDISSAYWLNPEYYREQFAGEDIWYFPAIVSKKGEVNQHHSLAVVDLLVKLAAATKAEPLLAFQCTNLSRDYITGPVVEAVINALGQYDIKMEQIADYGYVGYELSL